MSPCLNAAGALKSYQMEGSEASEGFSTDGNRKRRYIGQSEAICSHTIVVEAGVISKCTNYSGLRPPQGVKNYE